MKRFLSCLALLTVPYAVFGFQGTTNGLIPEPAKLEFKKGTLPFPKRWMIAGKKGDLFPVGDYLKREGNRLGGLSVESGGAGANIFFRLQKTLAGSSPERYRLSVGEKAVEIQAAEEIGLLRGAQSLLQLFSFYQGKKEFAGLPCLAIEDAPRFPFRSMHLDVSRHFFPVSFIKRYIDILAYYKINYFHWHLTDDNGWRLEIKKYPKLTSIGAYRVDYPKIPWNKRPMPKAGEKAEYGGFYTQNEARDIVAYAKARGITVIPEIEMPAHSLEVLAAYPELSCQGGQYFVAPGVYWPNRDLLCAGKEEVFTFLENVLTETMDIFPGPYLHIGGDEADKTRWKACPACQKRMKELGLANEGHLQGYFMERMAKFLTSRGRKALVWDEILEEGLTKNITVMSWRNAEVNKKALANHLQMIMTPQSFCYFNTAQNEFVYDGTSAGGLLPLKKVFQFDPAPDQEHASSVLGGGACLWTEYVESGPEVEHNLLPRLAAVSEGLWSPAGKKTFKDFSKRLQPHYDYYKQQGYHYNPESLRVDFIGSSKGRTIEYAMDCEAFNADIRYTLDGSEPKASSTPYVGPVLISQTSQIRAAAFTNGDHGVIRSESVQIHKAFGCPVTYLEPYSQKYSGSGGQALVNGFSGSIEYSDGRWQGFESVDMAVEIDLGRLQFISSVRLGFLSDSKNWIFPPTGVVIEYSQNGTQFNPLAESKLNHVIKEDSHNRESSLLQFKPVEAKKIRVRAKNRQECPDWHVGKGGKAWLFVDEVAVD